MIYLDNAATTFPKPECVYAATDDAQRNLAINAGRGTYASARKAAAVIEETRSLLAKLVRADSADDVVFSPSSTIAMNQIIGGIDWSDVTNVYISPFEHNAVVRPLTLMSNRYGFAINFIPFDGETQQLDAEKMANMFAIKHPDVVFVNHVSNVTGLILSVAEIIREAKKYNAVSVIDASQSLGMIDINIKNIGADYLVFAGHKNLYAHFGVGGFIHGGNRSLDVFLAGGTGSDSLNSSMPASIPGKFEPASPNVIAIASLNASLKWLSDTGIENIYSHKKNITEYAVERLSSLNDVKLYTPAERDSHIAVISLTHSNYAPNELAEILDADFGIAVRSGYHCAPHVHGLIGTENTMGTLRISVGFFTTTDDIDKLFSALSEL